MCPWALQFIHPGIQVMLVLVFKQCLKFFLQPWNAINGGCWLTCNPLLLFPFCQDFIKPSTFHSEMPVEILHWQKRIAADLAVYQSVRYSLSCEPIFTAALSKMGNSPSARQLFRSQTRLIIFFFPWLVVIKSSVICRRVVVPAQK